MKKYFYILLLSCLGNAVVGQNIDFVYSKEGGRKFALIGYEGLRTDTIARGSVSFMGTGKIVFPDKFKNYRGVVNLSFEGGSNSFFIFDGNSYSVEQTKENQLNFVGSNENKILYDGFISGADSTVKKEHPYANFYYSTTELIKKISAIQQQGGSLEENTKIRLDICKVDVDLLYHSPFWFYILDGILHLSGNNKGFAEDIISLLKITKTDKVYLGLVNDFITITEQYGLNDAFDIVISDVEQSGRIKYPQGKIYDAFNLIKVSRGKIIPNLDGLSKQIGKDGSKYSLLVFYQPGCDNCHTQLLQLKADYEYFKRNNVRIVTISASQIDIEFSIDKKTYPWEDQLCDLKGYSGPNFMKFGILGTPTLFLIDQNKVVLGRYAVVSEVKMELEMNQK